MVKGGVQGKELSEAKHGKAAAVRNRELISPAYVQSQTNSRQSSETMQCDIDL